MAKIKVNVSLDENLLSRIDDYADDNYINRSSVITLAATQYLNTEQVTKAIVDMSLAMRRIADNGSVSDEDRKILEEFEMLSKMLVNGK